MAIDLCVMSLSRYWSGNFTTPNMEKFHRMGMPYGIVGPGGTRMLPPGEPFGGTGAPAEQLRLAQMVRREVLAPLRQRGAQGTWNEESGETRWFDRLDPTSLGALLDEMSASLASKPSGWKGWFGALVEPHAVRCPIFLPSEFEDPIRVQGLELGSIPRLLGELDTIAPSQDALAAHRALSEAAKVAREIGLPLIIDS